MKYKMERKLYWENAYASGDMCYYYWEGGRRTKRKNGYCYTLPPSRPALGGEKKRLGVVIAYDHILCTRDVVCCMGVGLSWYNGKEVGS